MTSRQLEKSARINESLANTYEKNGRTADARTARIIAARYRKDLQEQS